MGNRQLLLSGVTGINSQTLSYDANDRLKTNSYDSNGNTLAAGSKTFAYDSQDRMTKFNGGAVTITYDGDGNRVAKTAGGVTTQFLVDDTNPTGPPQVAEEIVGGAIQRRYVYGVNRISQTQAGTTSFYGYDGHGDVRALMDATGTVTDTYDYDAFGNIVASTGTTPNVYRYQGEALDSETGLYYLRARYYDPTVGRFLSVDPMADQGQHPYTYAAADPVNRHDPNGEQDVIEYTLILAAFLPPPMHVPLIPDRISCLDAIVYSNMTPAQLMAKMGLACQVRGGSTGRMGPAPGGQDPKPKDVPTAVVATKDYMTTSTFALGAKERDIEYYLYSKDHRISQNDPDFPDANITEHLVRISGPKVPADNGAYPFEDQIAAIANAPFVRNQTFIASVGGVTYPGLPIVSCSNDVTKANRLDASSAHVLVNDKKSPDSYTCGR